MIVLIIGINEFKMEEKYIHHNKYFFTEVNGNKLKCIIKTFGINYAIISIKKEVKLKLFSFNFKFYQNILPYDFYTQEENRDERQFIFRNFVFDKEKEYKSDIIKKIVIEITKFKRVDTFHHHEHSSNI